VGWVGQPPTSRTPAPAPPPRPRARRSPREIVREVWRLALSERSSPRGIGLSFAAGAFAGCTPWGFHSWVALALATLLRLNRLWAFLASRFSIVPIYLWVAFCEIELGHRLRTGHWAKLAPHDAIAHVPEYLGDLLLGTLPVGLALAAIAGALAYGCARLWGKSPEGSPIPPPPRGEERRVSSRTLDAPLPPSSECPPSAPPDPSP
jgi:uncharacterized protein (DUF2062 family)